MNPGIKQITAFCMGFIQSVMNNDLTLFVLYFALNIIDTITGIVKARILKKESSKAGFQGVIKKLYGWIVILFGFLVSLCFQQIGKTLEMDLSISLFIGWYVLSILIINELRSILENLYEAGFPIPNILIKGLEIVKNRIDDKSKT